MTNLISNGLYFFPHQKNDEGVRVTCFGSPTQMTRDWKSVLTDSQISSGEVVVMNNLNNPFSKDIKLRAQESKKGTLLLSLFMVFCNTLKATLHEELLKDREKNVSLYNECRRHIKLRRDEIEANLKERESLLEDFRNEKKGASDMLKINLEIVDTFKSKILEKEKESEELKRLCEEKKSLPYITYEYENTIELKDGVFTPVSVNGIRGVLLYFSRKCSGLTMNVTDKETIVTQSACKQISSEDYSLPDSIRKCLDITIKTRKLSKMQKSVLDRFNKTV